MAKKYWVIVAIILMTASLGCIGENEEKPPRSLHNYYSEYPMYLVNMFDLGGSMMGIVVNLQQNDTENVKASFNRFSKLYKDTSNMVPEWNGYFDVGAVDKLGGALESGNPEIVFQALENVGKTCNSCHKAEKPAVWAKYYWKDFRDITMETGDPQEPELPFAAAKMKYMAPAFDGTIVNIKEGQKKEAADSWNRFNIMFSNLEKACLRCHSESPRYFVSEDIKSMISDVGKQITAGDLDSASNTMQQIGIESCYKCHMVHEPTQRIKESFKER